MSSSYKFESGLNNWVGSDKPARTDFVNDNEILTSEAMWKATYDTNNLEEDIFSYTNETVTKTARDTAFTTYAHRKNGTQHELTSETPSLLGRYDNIKFQCQGRFSAGDTFKVNGATCRAYTIDGQPLQDGFFTTGIVICFQHRDALYFAGGTSNALLRSGGQMAGSLKAYNVNRSDTDVRNIQIVESNGVTPASTMYIIGRRKY